MTPLEPRLPQPGPEENGFVRRLVTSLYDHLRAIYGRLRALQTNIDTKLASSSYTAADVLTKIKTVDGSGSGLDADTLDGISSAGFVAASNGAAEDLTVRASLLLDAGVEVRADWSNATTASRAYLQTSTTNGATGIPVLPNGTGTATAIRLYNNSAPASGQYVSLACGASSASINSTAESGTPQPFQLNVNAKQAVTIDTSGNVQLGGNNAALATTATTDFPCVPTCAGAPTGAFSPATGYAGMVVDTTNNRLYFRYGGAWKYVALT